MSLEKSLCCGGGGCGLFLEHPGNDMARARVEQAKERAVDTVVVACPNCYQMLDSVVKGGNYDMRVKDVAQLVREHL
jgi:Fe-S oxidoreductase